MNEGVKYVLDGASVSAVLGALAGFLPILATLLTVIWMSLRIYETSTVQGLLGRPKLPPADIDG